MKEKSDMTQPPRWAHRFLTWYCKPSLLEDLEGDLFEYYQRNVKKKGVTRARLIYVIDVFKFCRLYTVRKPEFINYLIHWIMIGSYVKTSMRSILRNRLFSTINIAGLAVSLSVGLIMIAVLNDLFSYDKFNVNHSNIYRVISRYEYLGKADEDFMATTSLKAGKLIKESFTGHEDVAILHREFSGDVTFGNKTVPLKGFWANESVLNVFSFELIQGNPRTALRNPNSIVITETSAKKLFGDAGGFGKTLSLNDRQYTVTGILKNVSRFSHIQFEILGSLSTREITEANNDREMKWDNMWGTWVYVLMKDDTDIADFNDNLKKLSEREDKTVQNTHVELALQPLSAIMMGEDLGNQIGPVMGILTVQIFSALAFVVILSAGFNYTNLSIARSFKRSREVGIRKTIGALRGHVMNQFIVESIIISLLALVIAFFLFVLLKPHFLNLEPSLQEILVLDLTPQLIFLFVAFTILIGTMAGLFPALFFARINAIQVLKNLTAVPALKGITMRKVLIVFQYTISIIFITATVIMHKQYKHFMAYDLGFSTENILNINLQGAKAELLKKELNELPEVQAISQSALITSVGDYWGTQMKNPNDPEDSARVYYNTVDENYLPLHGHKLIAGKNFTPASSDAEEEQVIVNEDVLKRFNIFPANPEKAIDQVVMVDRKPLRIVGVLKNFSYGRANGRSNAEVVIRYAPKQAGYVNVKILSSDWPNTYGQLETIWKRIDPVHPFEAKFYNEQLEEAFKGLSASIKLSGFLATLVICIASIGLLGMVVFTTEARLKEISVRKVLGASEGGLIYLLAKGFFILLSIATLIALPITYFFFDAILLPNLTNHAPIDPLSMLIGVLGVLVLAGLMIGSQTLKVARTNPADVLKVE